MPMLRRVITSADENCSICLETAEEQPLYTHAQDGQGRHYMHLSCAQGYLSTPSLLAREQSCPDCRVRPLEVPGWSPPRVRARWPLSVGEGLVGVSSAALIVMSLLARIGSVAAAALGNLGVAEVVSQMSHVYFKVGCVFGAAGVLMRFATHGIEGVQDLFAELEEPIELGRNSIHIGLAWRILSIAAAALGHPHLADCFCRVSHDYFRVSLVFGALVVVIRFSSHGIEGVQDLFAELAYESFLITEPIANELGFLVLRVRYVFGALFGLQSGNVCGGMN